MRRSPERTGEWVCEGVLNALVSGYAKEYIKVFDGSFRKATHLFRLFDKEIVIRHHGALPGQ